MISVVIPVLNEEKALPATLQRLLTRDGDIEFIVVEGGSYDKTLQLLEHDSRIQLSHIDAGRALHINIGAGRACD